MLRSSLSLSRRHFNTALGLCALGSTPLSRAEPVHPLHAVMQRSLGDETQAVLVWHLLTEQFQMAANLARCDAGTLPLAQLEWDGAFQSAMRGDGQAMHQLPIVQRFFAQPRFAKASRDWAALPAAQRTRWQSWLGSEQAAPTLASLRAGLLLDSWQTDGWLLDVRTGQGIATPPVLAARALQQLGQLGAVTQVINSVDAKLGQGWARIGQQAKLTQADASWVRPLAQGLEKRASDIAERFEQHANRHWPQRKAWADSKLGQFTLQTQSRSPEFAEAGFKMRPADWVPQSMASLCKKA